MNILVTGGAGYIGSALVKSLCDDHNVIVIDNLSRGKLKYVDKRAKFYKKDLTEDLTQVFSDNKLDVIFHLAAYKSVEESMIHPKKYQVNLTGTINLLENMAKFLVEKIIFSSSATVYGTPKYSPMDECHPIDPCSYYGFTKIACEDILKWYSKIYGFSYIMFRFFNVVGDIGLNYEDEDSPQIFPKIIEAIKKDKKFIIYGDDYSTRDGTCIRDYIHLYDIIEAHKLAIKKEGNHIFNLGTAKGTTVKELLDTFIKITDIDFEYIAGNKRKGDSPIILASSNKAKGILKWQPKKDLNDVILSTASAYNLKSNKFLGL